MVFSEHINRIAERTGTERLTQVRRDREVSLRCVRREVTDAEQDHADRSVD